MGLIRGDELDPGRIGPLDPAAVGVIDLAGLAHDGVATAAHHSDLSAHPGRPVNITMMAVLVKAWSSGMRDGQPSIDPITAYYRDRAIGRHRPPPSSWFR